MVIDPIAKSLEKRKLWRRAATRYLELLPNPLNTEDDINWLIWRREYCIEKALQMRAHTVHTDTDTRYNLELPGINLTFVRKG